MRDGYSGSLALINRVERAEYTTHIRTAGHPFPGPVHGPACEML